MPRRPANTPPPVEKSTHVTIGHGRDTLKRKIRHSLLTRPFKKNSAFGRQYALRLGEFLAHVSPSGEPTVAQRRVADQLARLTLISDTCWAAVNRDGVLDGGKVTAAFEALMRALREERTAMLLVGLERRSKPVPTLNDYLDGLEPEEDTQ